MLAKLKTTLSNLKLSRQIGILLSLVLLGGVLLSSISLDIILKNIAQAEVVIEAEGLLRMTNAIRGYTSEQVFPQLVKRSETEFLPQSIPSFAMREIFQIARKDPAWQDYFYKDATLNPTNLRDKADSFETEIVNHFRQDNNLKELSGIQSTPSGKLFYLAQPIKIEKASCLECHYTPDKAPKTMIERYGSANGFGWQLNEIVGARMIYVPALKVLQKARQSFVVIMAIVMAILAVTIFLVNWWLKQAVVRPLRRITQVAEAVSTGDLEADFESQSNDEVGSLVEAFMRMKTSLALAMKKLERYSPK